MSTSLVMMDTGALRRTASNNSSAGDLKPASLASNSPINFAMKFLAHNSANHNNTPNNLHLHLHHPSSNGIPTPVTAASTPLVAVKLEPRIPSPCTADLAIKNENQSASGPSVKDLSFYLAKSAAATGHQLMNGGSMNSVDTNLGGPITALSMKQRRDNDGYLPGQTMLPNGTSSPSPPPLLPNGHYYTPTPTNKTQFKGNLTSGQHVMKRDHDVAFGASSTTNTPITINVSNNSLPTSSTNSPSPPPLLTNGHHPMGTMIPNGGSIASPTSSSFSDFGSTGKEDMSPSNSVNGYVVDSLGGDKKKKGPAPRQQEELCLVCGDRASGYHYNALTCEGCKGFFRRSITKNAVYQCKYGNNCDIDMYMRRKCQECRLKKCLSVGMRPECVVPEYQCAIKREAKRAVKDKPNSTTKESINSPGTPQMMDEKQPLTPQMPPAWTSPQIIPEVIEQKQTVMPLPHEYQEVIKKLVFYQDEYESPSEDDIKKIAPFPLGDEEDDNQKRFQHVTEMTILTVQLIVEFSKRVPHFDKLFREDQITLLKACSSEVMMLRCSRKYDIRTDSIVYANNQPYTRENYTSASISYVADSLFNFCRRMCMLKVDNAEYALITAIVIFSDRPQLLEPRKVEEIQEHYIEILRLYVKNQRPFNKCHFAKLLGILTELRTLGNINSEMCVSLKVQNKKLPAFLAEIWDIQE